MLRYEARDPPVEVMRNLINVKERIDAYAFFCYRADDDGALHVTLVVDDNASVVLERSESAHAAAGQQLARTSK